MGIRVIGFRIPKMKTSIDVTFTSVDDFRRRIIGFWQRQKENEEYNFIFLCPEAEKEFEKLVSAFHFKDMIEN